MATATLTNESFRDVNFFCHWRHPCSWHQIWLCDNPWVLGNYVCIFRLPRSTMACRYDQPDKGYAWVVLICICALNAFLATSFGPFGIILVEYLEHFACSTTEGAAIGATLHVTVGITGMIYHCSDVTRTSGPLKSQLDYLFFLNSL